VTRRTIVLASFLLSAGPAAAQETVRLTLAEALERARGASPALARLLAVEEAARAEGRLARAGRLPQVDLQASYTRQSDVPELTLTLPGQPPRTIFPNLPDNYRTRIGAEVPLYTGGRLGAQARAARHEEEAASLDRQTGGIDLTLEVTNAYWSLVTARETDRVLGEAVTAYDAHLKDATNRERLGLAARNEVLAVQVERDRAELSQVQAANAAALAEANLVRLLALAPGTSVEAAEPLAGEPGAPSELEPLVATALAARSDRAALAARVAAAEARIRVEKAARLPRVSAGAGFDYANPNRRILPPDARWQDTWDVSLSLGWTLFDGGRAKAATDRAAARTEALRRQLEDTDRRIRLEVTQRHLDRTAERRALEVAERAVTSARENLRVASERHRAGVIPFSERLDAEIALLRASLDRTHSLAQLRVAEAALLHAVGK
jgi:outer membrane protein